MKTRVFEIEITRHNVTPSQFLAYVRRRVDAKGGRYLRGDLYLSYFEAGNDLNFDIKHEEGTPNAGLHEKSISKPYEMQTYLRYPNGATYNEICEFEFWDDKTGTGYYYLLNIEVLDETEEDIMIDIRNTIEQEPTKSAWRKGVVEYALELVQELREAIEGGYFDKEDLGSPKLLERALLNGAEDWNQYSWGGCSLIYDPEIAARLCTPSELKKTRNGDRRPNSREEWLDTQARALYQAARLVKNTAAKLTNGKGVTL